MLPLQANLAAVAFDLDETLYDREAAVDRLLLDWMPAMTALEQQEFRRRDERGHSPRMAFFAWVAAQFPQLGGDAKALWERFRSDLPRYILADSEAEPLLAALQEKYALAVLSNGDFHYQKRKLLATGLTRYFAEEKVLISGGLGAAKPDLRAFAALEAVLELPASKILFVGDHYEKDIVGAKSAGMVTCWLRRRETASNEPARAHADITIHSLAELVAFL